MPKPFRQRYLIVMSDGEQITIELMRPTYEEGLAYAKERATQKSHCGVIYDTCSLPIID